MSVNDNQLIFTSDKPVIEDRLGTHKHLARLLVQIVKSKSDNPLVVGIFGGWGSGKSSIIRMYEGLVTKHDIKNIYLDAWTLTNAKERFGAGLLKALSSEILSPKDGEKFISEIDKKTDTWDTKRAIGPGTWVYILLIIIVLLFLFYYLITGIGLNNETAITLITSLIIVLVVNGLFEFVLPKTMTTFESRTYDDSYNKVEHFQKKFKEAISKSKDTNISLVVDNLDRVEPVDALEMIRMLKSFLSDDLLGKKRLTLIVPCDEQELAKHIHNDLYITDVHEFLRKFFNVTVNVPDLIHEDIASFTKKEFDAIYKNLSPVLSDEEANLVSFIISRAARKNPRQVKVLINSFVSYWQSAGLAGTAGLDRGISPLGAAVYISLSYLKGDEPLPKTVEGIFSFLPKGNEETLMDFTNSIREFINRISDLEWSYLKRLQLSENEKSIPNFMGIYFAITGHDWQQVDSLLLSNNVDVIDLISRLDTKTREEDAVSRERFIKWVLSLISEGKLKASLLPRNLISYINYKISSNENDWLQFIDTGLAEYMIQIGVDYKNIISVVNNLKVKFEGGSKPTNAQVQFISRLVSLTKSDFWKKHPFYDKLSGELDANVYHLMQKVDNTFIELLLKNLHVIVYEGTGIRLAEEMTSRSQKDEYIGSIEVDNMFSAAINKSVGLYAFAGKYLQQIQVIFAKSITSGKLSITLQSIEALYTYDNLASIQKHLPTDNNIQELVGVLESYFSRGVNKENSKHISVSILILALSTFLINKIGANRNSSVAHNCFRDNLFPRFSSFFAQLDEDDKSLFVSYIDKYPKILSLAKPSDLSLLAQNTELSIPFRIFSEEPGQFSKLVGELLEKDSWIKVISYSLQYAKQNLDNNAFEKSLVESIFSTLERKNPNPQKYQEVTELLKSTERYSSFRTLSKKHMLFLIDRTNWGDKSSINITIEKLKTLDTFSPIDGNQKDMLREKLNPDMLTLLPDASRNWIKQQLD
jgi:hypothetical protein